MSREREEGGQAACQPGIARKCPFFAVYPGHRRGVGQQNSRAETETVSDSIDATYKQKAGPAFALCAAARQAVGIERLFDFPIKIELVLRRLRRHRRRPATALNHQGSFSAVSLRAVNRNVSVCSSIRQSSQRWVEGGQKPNVSRARSSMMMTLHDCDRLSTLTEGGAQGLNKRAAGGSPCIAPGKGLG